MIRAGTTITDMAMKYRFHAHIASRKLPLMAQMSNGIIADMAARAATVLRKVSISL